MILLIICHMYIIHILRQIISGEVFFLRDGFKFYHVAQQICDHLNRFMLMFRDVHSVCMHGDGASPG
jgi:hypothetical protein